MRRTSWASCKATGKRAFRTEEEAERVLIAARIQRENLRRKVPTILRRECRAYQCDWCDLWHVTSKEEVPA